MPARSMMKWTCLAGILLWSAASPNLFAQGFPFRSYMTELKPSDLPPALEELKGRWNITFTAGSQGTAATYSLTHASTPQVVYTGTVTQTTEPQIITVVETAGNLCPVQSNLDPVGRYAFYALGLDLRLSETGDDCAKRRLILGRHVLHTALQSLLTPHSDALERYEGALRFLVDSMRSADVDDGTTLPRQPPLDPDINLLLQVSAEELVQATNLIVLRDKTIRDRQEASVRQARGGSTFSVEQWDHLTRDPALIGLSLDPAAVIAGIIGIGEVLGSMLDQLQANVATQLFGLREYVAGTVRDLNVVFRDRLTQTFDQLSVQQKEALAQAQLLAHTTVASLEQLQTEGFQNAQNALCDATALMANYPVRLVELSLLRPKPPKPDIICLYTPTVRDPGSPQETLLRFRGVNLLEGNKYPNTTLTVSSRPGQTMQLATAGGSSSLLVALPGQLNGSSSEAQQAGAPPLRGDLLAQLGFDWIGEPRSLRWFVTVKPFVIRRIDVTVQPQIDVSVYSLKSDICYVNAPGGSFKGQERHMPCALSAEGDGEQAGCWDETTTHNGDAGIEAHDFTTSRTTCYWLLRAKSKGWWKGSAWHGVRMFLRQRSRQRIAGPTLNQHLVVTQGNDPAPIRYDVVLPAEATTADSRWQYEVRIVDNTGRETVLTELIPTATGVGAALIDQRTGTLTIRLDPAFHN
jgi:hypothetical protein